MSPRTSVRTPVSGRARTRRRPAAFAPAALTPAALALAGALTAALVLTACGASGPRTGPLVTGSPGAGAGCRVHQPVAPDHDYTAGREGEPLAVLTMLRYYTAQRSLPFCDGRPATARDAAWARLYTGLTRR